MRKNITAIALACLFGCASTAYAQMKLVYPPTAKSEVTDDYHGTKVADPYRWLEDDNSAETRAWVENQNKVTNAYLNTIPFREKVKERLSELWNYPRYGSPTKQGDYYYFFKNDGLQNQSIMYRQKGINGTPEIFLDPNKLSADGTAALGGAGFSQNHKYYAYMVAQSGSDWQEAFLIDVKTGTKLEDNIKWIKFSGISWKGDEGFFYSRYPEPDEQSKLSKQNQFHQVWYHKIGTPQSEDQLIFKDSDHPLRNAGGGLTDDGRFLLIYQSQGTSGTQLLVRDMKDPAQTGFKALIEGFATNPSVIDNVGDKLLVRTNEDAPNYKVVLIDPKNPGKANWKTVIPEQKEVLQSIGTGGGFLFASYLKDASTRVYQYQYNGKKVREIKLPGIGTASGFGGEKKDKEFFYTFTSFNYPPTIFRYDIASGKSTLFRKSEAKFDAAAYETKQVFFKSKDGERIPMFLTYRKGMKLNGDNPVLLYGYGGFNIPMTPGFNVANAFFMEQGGIYAVVNLRGGNEYGEAWHKAGMLGNKQNVFNDFIAAAEYLIAEKYTNKNRIAIRGGSNGGLLVGACMTQRPDLFKVALPQVGVMDMLRYHKFTIGWAWATEYGRSDSADAFQWLYKYSPLHNIKKGTHYPATMITTADHDDRVVPAHSFKFAAALQEAQTGDHAALIRIESKAGHGAGKPTSKQIEEATDIWSFVMYNLGMSMK
jgi:prolyl oligopeptidase